MKKILLFDTSLRDGEQSAGAMLKATEKLEIARQLEKLGVDVIEAGFPISSPGDFRAVSLIAKQVKKPAIAALARCVEKDIKTAAQALKGTKKSRIHVFLPSSDIHLEKKLEKTRLEALKIAADSVRMAKALTSEVEYSPEDATRTDFEYLVKVAKTVIEAGARVVNIPDTVGYSTPEEFGSLIRRIKQRVPEFGKKALLSVHCHDDLGLSVANSLEAVLNGADQVEGTINGVGERAGNAALEEIAMILKVRKDLFGKTFSTGINTREIKKASRLISDLLGIPIQPNKAVVGKNAFAHSSGIHQHGVLADRRTYEIMRPEDIGEKQNEIILTARSGRHGLVWRLEALGYKKLTTKEIEKIYREFIKTADSQKTVTDADLKKIIASLK
ncbi:MAG: 2-isopropylmalate synthase [Candidatus Nealsonbacteria bacterium]|nr:2-isopropylmalate synthase [Candidatus Nealsonbacteria bacterium]